MITDIGLMLGPSILLGLLITVLVVVVLATSHGVPSEPSEIRIRVRKIISAFALTAVLTLVITLAVPFIFYVLQFVYKPNH